MNNSIKNYYVYVISKDGRALMPTKRFRKVRLLLKSGLAKAVKRKPFTIQLLYKTSGYIQDVIIGIDPGSQTIGVTARKDNGTIIFAGEIESRKTEVSQNMTERQMHRRSRRGHRRKRLQRQAKRNGTFFLEKQYDIAGTDDKLNCKYIKPGKIKFLNRKREDGWLTPTAKNLLDTHKNIVTQIEKMLPISKIYLEYSKFDIHKLLKPEIKGKAYQEGRKKGFLNSQAYVLCRDQHRCKLCKKNKGILQVHHLLEVHNGGSDNPENLITLCEKCHKKVHKSSKTASNLKKIFANTTKRYVHTTLLNTVMPYFYEWLQIKFSKVFKTYGYETKEKRYKFGLKKTHFIDAYLVSLKKVECCNIPDFDGFTIYKYKPFRRHHRQIIHAMRDRNYKLANKIVAKNRNKRMGQLTDSLADFTKSKGVKILSQLRVLPGKKVIRSKFKKFAKGDTIKSQGEYYIVKGYGEMGRSVGFVGKKEYVPTKNCKLIMKNTGIVCL